MACVSSRPRHFYASRACSWTGLPFLLLDRSEGDAMQINLSHARLLVHLQSWSLRVTASPWFQQQLSRHDPAPSMSRMARIDGHTFKRLTQSKQKLYPPRSYPCYRTLHNNIPPIFLSTHSLASRMPLSVLTYRHSPGRVKPSTYPFLLPRVKDRSPSTSIHIRLVGLLTNDIFSSTGSLFQYFMPNHNLLLAIFCRVTGSISWPGVFDEGCERRWCAGGGSGPPRTTVDMKPLL